MVIVGLVTESNGDVSAHHIECDALDGIADVFDVEVASVKDLYIRHNHDFILDHGFDGHEQVYVFPCCHSLPLTDERSEEFEKIIRKEERHDDSGS